MRSVAVLETIFLAPAALFMGALVTRGLTPAAEAPAEAAQQVVMWYAGRAWTLWLLLLALPLGALVTGCAALGREWRRGNSATLLLGAAALSAGEILAVVVLHMLAN